MLKHSPVVRTVGRRSGGYVLKQITMLYAFRKMLYALRKIKIKIDDKVYVNDKRGQITLTFLKIFLNYPFNFLTN